MMPAALGVVALISGGKDSFFSVLHCVQNGHNLIALANLYPPSTSSTETSDSCHDIDSANRCQASPLNARTTDHERECPDLNSFMYQTVGHTVVPLYSTALQLPLYRRQITGTSIQQSQHYDTSSQRISPDQSTTRSRSRSDETEDLVPLLREIINAHPEANAVCTGAILSTYQRTRIESVALKLGLTPLSYLWQYPLLPPPVFPSDCPLQASQPHRPDSLTGLLEDIRLSGLDARIIKIASAGVSDHLLFANVADPQTQSRLLNDLSPFFNDDDEIGLRGAILGEGGEYETIALNGPREVWKGGRIDIDSSNNEVYTEGGVHYLKFGQARIVPHDEEPVSNQDNVDNYKSKVTSTNLVAVPSLFDPQFVSVKDFLNHEQFNRLPRSVPIEDVSSAQELEPAVTDSGIRSSPNEDDAQYRHVQTPAQVSLTISDHTITINNLTALTLDAIKFWNGATASITETITTNSIEAAPAQITAATQFKQILDHLPVLFEYVQTTFGTPDLSTRNISSTTLLLRSMSDFTLVNPIYARIWPKGLPNPPARVTIAAPLPSDTYVSLSVTLDLCCKENRRGLHVQGWSYWAPANIGPYSQAVSVPLQDFKSTKGRIRDEIDNSDGFDVQNLEIAHIAGQIPLVPSTMQIHTGAFLERAILSAQHLWRIGQERGVDIWPWSVAYLAKTNADELVIRASTASAVWRQAHFSPTWTIPQDDGYDDEDESNDGSEEEDDDDTFDVWNLQHNRSQQQGFRRSQTSVGKHRHILPNHSIFNSTNSSKQKYVPPFTAVEVNALPRDVDIEWWSNGIAGLAKSSPGHVHINWQRKALPHGYVSCLTIVPDPSAGRSVKFITYQIPSFSGLSNKIPTTLSAILQSIEDQNSNSLPQDAELVQGTAFVTTATLSSKEWAFFLPSSTESGLPYTQPTAATASSSRPLGSQVSIIPCHRLWGCPMSSVQNRKHTQNNETSTGQELEELVLTFVLRVNVI